MPIYNRRFAIQAKEKETFHRKLPEGFKLDTVLCRKTERTVRNDFTVSHKGVLYQITERTEARKVTVEERINGSLHITYKGIKLKFREITQRPRKEPRQKQKLRTNNKKYTPPANHPWRRYNLKKNKLKTGS